VAVFPTLVQTKQIRKIYINETIQKNTVQTIQNTINTSTHITKTPTRYKTHTYTHLHIKKQVKTTTVQYTPKWNDARLICHCSLSHFCCSVNLVSRWGRLSVNMYKSQRWTNEMRVTKYWLLLPEIVIRITVCGRSYLVQLCARTQHTRMLLPQFGPTLKA